MAKKKKNKFFSWLDLNKQFNITKSGSKDISDTNLESNSTCYIRETNAIYTPITKSAKEEIITSPIAFNKNVSSEKYHDSKESSLTLTADTIRLSKNIPLTIVDHESLSSKIDNSFFTKLKNSLLKTRQNLGSGFIRLLSGKKIDNDLFEKIEEQLLIADIGFETTHKIIDSLITHTKRCHLKKSEILYNQLRLAMTAILINVEQPLKIAGKTPFIIMMVGVNGVGKTTTIGKLARQYQTEGKSVILAAGDTFRAAASEQLQEWGKRNCVQVVAQKNGADAAAVIFDAIQIAKKYSIDVLIIDTAGRLHNKTNLMNELKKIVKVIKKIDANAPHEIILIIDANTGMNAINQTNLFNDAVGITGIILTKLDGTAKGGIIFPIADQFRIPIRYISIGERIDDLRPFKAKTFIEALFPEMI